MILAINGARWDRFSPEDQALLQDAEREAMEAQRRIVEEEDRTRVAQLRGEGMQILALSTEALALFKARITPLYQAFAGRLGADLVHRCRRAVAEGNPIKK